MDKSKMPLTAMFEEIKTHLKNNTSFYGLSEVIGQINPDTNFISWESGLTSTERRNLSRVIKILDLLDELNSYNLKEGDKFFKNIHAAILTFMEKAGYDHKINNRDSYSFWKNGKN